MDEWSDLELLLIHKASIHSAVEVEQVDRAMSVLRSRLLAPSTHRRMLREDYSLQLLRGRPEGAVRVAILRANAVTMAAL